MAFTKNISQEDGSLRAELAKKGVLWTSLDFLYNWLNTHIKGTDKKYGPFFNQHGLK